MKKSLFSRIKLAALAVFALLGAVASRAMDAVAPRREFVPGMALKQGGFVTLGRSYMGYPAGSVVELTASTEAALIAAGQATASAGPPTPGPVSTTASAGCAAIPAGASSVVITNPVISPQSQVFATVAQAAADATLLRVERVVCGAGFVTIYGTANATAAVSIDWAIINAAGVLSSPQ